MHARTHTHMHTQRFYSPLGFCPGLPGLASTRKVKPGKVNQSEFTRASDSQWQWHQPGHMQICTMNQTHNCSSIPSLSFLQARCPTCHPTNSVKALKVKHIYAYTYQFNGHFNASLNLPSLAVVKENLWDKLCKFFMAQLPSYHPCKSAKASYLNHQLIPERIV